MVEYKSYITKEISDDKFNSFLLNFNESFDLDFPLSFFFQQYSKSFLGFSFHSFMEDDDNIVGACSAVPYQYNYDGRLKTFCLLVGLFVSPSYRKDPYALHKIYNNLKKLMISYDISLALAVPNNNSYLYFKRILKWQDIGKLTYYALPVRIGNIKSKPSLLNLLSWLASKMISKIGVFYSYINYSREGISKIHLIRNLTQIETHRYYNYHTKVTESDFSMIYRISTDNGISTVYIIDFYNTTGARDNRSFAKSIDYLLKYESMDLIIFVGTLDFKQSSMIKVPVKYQPRELTFNCEILDSEIKKEKVLDLDNWNFGLLNFDAR